MSQGGKTTGAERVMFYWTIVLAQENSLGFKQQCLKRFFCNGLLGAKKKSILKVNLRHYKNFLDQNYWLMKRSPLYCGHFATLGHILRLFISVLGPFQRDGAKHPMKLIIISCQLQMLFHCSALHEQPQFKYKNIISNQQCARQCLVMIQIPRNHLMASRGVKTTKKGSFRDTLKSNLRGHAEICT